MKKTARTLCVLLTVVFITMILAGCGGNTSSTPSTTPSDTSTSTNTAPASTNETSSAPVEIVIAHTVSPTDPTHRAFELFKQLIEEKSNGTMTVSIYPNGQLGKTDTENLELLSRGAIQMTFTASSGLATMGNVKEYFIYDYPYFFDNDEEIYKISDGELGAAMDQKLVEATGMLPVANYVFGWMIISNNSTQLLKPGDINGLKIRVLPSEVYQATMSKVGGTPISMGFGELMPALQQGTVDGVMTTPNLYVSSKLYEVQKYATDVKIGVIQHYAVTNEKWYNTLSSENKAIFDECIKEYEIAVRQYMKDEDTNAREVLRANMEFTDLDDTQMQMWKEYLITVVDDRSDIAGSEMVAAAKQLLGK